jgi:hypothetical protein
VTDDFWLQICGFGFLLVCFFRAGARCNGVAMSAAGWFEIFQLTLACLLLFALVTEGRGCRQIPADPLYGALDGGFVASFGLSRQPIEQRLGHGQRRTDLTPGHTRNRRLSNAAGFRNTRVLPSVQGQLIHKLLL